MKWKRIWSLLLAAVLLLSGASLCAQATEAQGPVLAYTFENAENAPALFGNAALAYDEDSKGGKVLSLDGTAGTYAEIPQGFFDGRDVMTVLFDVKPGANSGNFFTFTFGRNNEVYDFFRIRDNEIRNAITLYSYPNEQEARYLGSVTGRWMSVALVFENTSMKLYVDGVLVSENADTGIRVSDMGSGLLSYFGKSLYDGDGYFNGSFDNFEVYDRVLDSSEIREKAIDNQPEEPLLRYTFEDGTGLPEMFGNAATAYNDEKKSKVLHLDGSNGTYASLPQGLLDGRDELTVLFDVKALANAGNYFTFAFGKDNTKYDFFRIRGSEIRNAITVNSYFSEQEARTAVDYAADWLSVALVFAGTSMRLYVNGNLAAENGNTGIRVSDLGTGLLAYLGKSFYDGDGYFNGYFDNFEIYNGVLPESAIREKAMLHLPLLISASVGSVVNPDTVSGTDSHTAVSCRVDRETGNITSYVQRRQNVKAVPVSFYLLNPDCRIYVDGREFVSGCLLDLTYERRVRIVCGDTEETYTLKTPAIAGNPVLPGMYADPDIRVLDDKFWIYPTTDGTPGWGGTQFHAFSSRDLLHWVDEGVILDTKNKAPGANDKGVAVAASAWSDGNAWAPAIEGKNGKYYFYYCGRIADAYTSLYGEGMAIGVAWANSPAGPYTASDVPILYPKMLENANIGFAGQVIDPSVYTEGNTSYLLFGNGSAAMVTLNSDMLSVNTSSFRLLTGLNEFRESIAVFKREGYYYFTWSCDDTGSENYHINYGTASSLTGKITNQGTLLQKDSENGILATGHQSVLYLPGADKCYIAYHRFYTPLSVGGNVGHRRETCIDEITFKNKFFSADLMNPVTPTMQGVTPIDVNGNVLNEVTVYPTCTENGSVTAGSLSLSEEEAPEIKAAGHCYLRRTQAPTCTESGYEEYVCTVCGETYRDNVTPATGHQPAFIRGSGTDEFILRCQNCDYEKTYHFADYLNLRSSDAAYDALLDCNGDGIINAKDYALLLEETNENQ